MGRIAESAGIDYQKCRASTVQSILGVSAETLRKWFRVGAPKNKDNTVSARDIISWKLNRELDKIKVTGGSKQDEELRKLELQNKKLEAEITKIEEKFIPIERYQDLINTQTQELKTYLTEGYKINIPTMSAKLGLDRKGQAELREELGLFITEALNAFVAEGNGKNGTV